MKSPNLHYLITQRSGHAVAHCLDLNIMATAQAGIPEALRRLDILVRASRFIPGGMKKAPEEYWKQFHQGTPYEDGERFIVWNLGRILLANPETRATSARSASQSLLDSFRP